eukprot:TRINITY_DN4304_c0_g1_i1.p1 TRINITY_DN4304_c0_g1~~TRINITY_DN4304_c0_g1_i1.p1  ORF type:complete len:494 (+),score=141.55 TRINITY_DN4304_c0_g1_i1:43-1524(+)
MDNDIEALLKEVKRLRSIEKTARKYAARAEAACIREGLLRDDMEGRVLAMVENERRLFDELEGVKELVKESEAELLMVRQKSREAEQKHERELAEVEGRLLVQLADVEEDASKSLTAEVAALQCRLKEAEKSNKAGGILIEQLSKRLAESGLEVSHLKDVNTELVNTLNDDDSLRRAQEKIEALEERCLQASKTIARLQLQHDETDLIRKRLNVLQQHTESLASANASSTFTQEARHSASLQRELEEMREERDMLSVLVSESDFMLKSRSELVRQLWKFYNDVKNTSNTLQGLQASSSVRSFPSNNHIKKQLLVSLESIQSAKGKGRWIISNYLTEVEKLHLGIPISFFQPDDKVINSLGLEPNKELDMELKRMGGYEFVKSNIDELIGEARRRGFPIEEFTDILPPAATTAYSPARYRASEWNQAVDSPPRPHLRSLSPRLRKGGAPKDSLTYASQPPSPSRRRSGPQLEGVSEASEPDLISQLRSASTSRW